MIILDFINQQMLTFKIQNCSFLKEDPMIIVHHLNHSRSHRILWLLEELGVEYEIKSYQRDPETLLAPPELKTVHPLGRSPVITDGEVTVAESGAITEYLVNKYGRGRWKGTDPLKYTYWLHFAEGSAMFPLVLTLIFNKIESSSVPFFIKPVIAGLCTRVRKGFIHPNLKTNFAYIESELSKSEWFAGDEFSAADIQMSFPLEAAAVRATAFLGPKSLSFVEKIHQRPAYQRAVERGGTFQIL